MKTFIVSATVVFFAFCSSAFAQFEEEDFTISPYLKFGAGIVVPDDAEISSANVTVSEDFENGFGIFSGVGFAVENSKEEIGLAFEVEHGYRSYDGETVSGTVEINTLMLNGLIVFSPNASISPYAGGGVGFSFGNYEDSSVEVDDTAFATQAMVGVLVGTDSILLDFGARYIFAEHDVLGADADVGDLSVTAGLRFKL